MGQDLSNGAKLLLDEVNEVLENKRLPHKDRLMWRIHEYQLRETVSTRGRLQKVEGDIETLKSNSILLWAKSNKKAAAFGLIGFGVLNSMVSWSGIRKPLLAALLGYVGIKVDPEQLP